MSMQKRGSVELMILFVVLIVAILGLVFVFVKKPNASGMDTVPFEDQPGNYELTMLDCQSACFGGNAAIPFGPARQPLGGAALRQCLADCSNQYSVNAIPAISDYH